MEQGLRNIAARVRTRYSFGLWECDSAEQVKTLEANDPAIKAGLWFRYEVLPMPQAIVRPRS